MTRRSLQGLAMIIACVALLVAMVGVSSAAAQSTNSKQASISKKHKAKRGPRGKRGAKGATGPQGATGAPGAAGVPGEAVAYALVNENGTVDPAHSKNVTSANVTHPETGVYCFHGLSFTPTSVIASPNEGGVPIPAIAAGTSEVLGGFCDLSNQAGAFIWNQVPELEDYKFTIWFEK